MGTRDKYLILTAGGQGCRMGGNLPKQMLEIDGVPIMKRTLDLFLNLPFEIHVIIVINPSIRDLWKEYCLKTDLIFPYYLVNGGMTRFHSVKNGLKYLPNGAVVAVHDAVRPLLRTSEIAELFECAEEHPAVVPAVEVVDSMRELSEDGSSVIVDRNKYRLIQTPQIFHSEVLKAAYDTAFSPEFTDDASVVEKSGVPLYFCRGSRYNIKITTPEDLSIAEAIFRTI